MPKPRRGGGNNGGLSWVKKSEPKFIREFKQRIAYKEQANVETKKKKEENDLLIEKEEDKPQIVKLKSGDLGEEEYLAIKSKEEIENGASSFGKILFKKPTKKSEINTELKEKIDQESDAQKKTNEIDLIFNLNEDGTEEKETEIDEEKTQDKNQIVKKNYLDDEEQKTTNYGLQEPPTKKRFIDKQKTKATSLSASQVLARESKAGNKKMLSFYDEEEEDEEENEKDLDD